METADISSVLSHHGYDLIQQIGKGGYAECFLVFSRKYQISFACKIITMSSTNDEIMMESFVTELHALCSITHPNIVQVFDKFVTKTHVYLILEYCPNGDLGSYIVKNGPILNEMKMLKILQNMLRALEYLEINKIAHNDIKPGNFLIDQHGRVKLTDFGLTKTLDSENDLCDDFRGSISFLSPEMASFIPFNPLRSDIWAFGVTIYFLATGEFPFSGFTIEAVKLSILQGKYSFPKTIPKIIKEIITQCLQINPVKRPTFSQLKELVEGRINHKMDDDPFDKKPQITQYKSNSIVARFTRPRTLAKPIRINKIKSFAGLY